MPKPHANRLVARNGTADHATEDTPTAASHALRIAAFRANIEAWSERVVDCFFKSLSRAHGHFAVAHKDLDGYWVNVTAVATAFDFRRLGWPDADARGPAGHPIGPRLGWITLNETFVDVEEAIACVRAFAGEWRDPELIARVASMRPRTLGSYFDEANVIVVEPASSSTPEHPASRFQLRRSFSMPGVDTKVERSVWAFDTASFIRKTRPDARRVAVAPAPPVVADLPAPVAPPVVPVVDAPAEVAVVLPNFAMSNEPGVFTPPPAEWPLIDCLFEVDRRVRAAAVACESASIVLETVTRRLRRQEEEPQPTALEHARKTLARTGDHDAVIKELVDATATLMNEK